MPEMVRDYRSGSEALDATEAEALLLELYAGGLPSSGMSARQRARAYGRAATLASQISELCAALAQGLSSGVDGGGR